MDNWSENCWNFLISQSFSSVMIYKCVCVCVILKKKGRGLAVDPVTLNVVACLRLCDIGIFIFKKFDPIIIFVVYICCKGFKISYFFM